MKPLRLEPGSGGKYWYVWIGEQCVGTLENVGTWFFDARENEYSADQLSLIAAKLDELNGGKT